VGLRMRASPLIESLAAGCVALERFLT
jgi:hypothetical protein